MGHMVSKAVAHSGLLCLVKQLKLLVSASLRTLHIAVWHQGTEAEFQQHCPRKRYQRCFCQDFPAGHVIKSPPCNAGAIGLMPGQGTMIPHAKRQLSLHGTARERLHAPSGRAHTSNQESRCQEEPTHPTKSPDVRKSPHIQPRVQTSGRAHTSNQESRHQEEPTHYKGDPTQPRTKLFLSTEISIKTHKVQAVGFRFTVGFSEDSPVRQPLR